MYGDKYRSKTTDGAKVIVCKLKTIPMGYTSIAYQSMKCVSRMVKRTGPFDAEASWKPYIGPKIRQSNWCVRLGYTTTETQYIPTNYLNFK